MEAAQQKELLDQLFKDFERDLGVFSPSTFWTKRELLDMLQRRIDRTIQKLERSSSATAENKE